MPPGGGQRGEERGDDHAEGGEDGDEGVGGGEAGEEGEGEDDERGGEEVVDEA